MLRSVLSKILFFTVSLAPAQDHRVSGWPVPGQGEDGTARDACDTVRLFTHPDPWPSGAVVDGEHIWISSNSGDQIYAYDTSGNIVDSLEVPEYDIDPVPGGMVILDGVLHAVLEEVRQLVRYDLTTHSIIDQTGTPGNSNIWGIEFLGGYFWLSNYDQLGGTALYKCDPATLEPLDTLALVGPDILELQVSGGELYGIGISPPTLYRIDTETGALGPSWDWCIPYPLGTDVMGEVMLGVSSALFGGGRQAVFQYDQDPLGVAPLGTHHPVVRVSPNPTSGEVRLFFDGVVERVTVFAGDGRTVLDRNGFMSGQALDMSGLENGTYLVALANSRGLLVTRVSIIH